MEYASGYGGVALQSVNGFGLGGGGQGGFAGSRRALLGSKLEGQEVAGSKSRNRQLPASTAEASEQAKQVSKPERPQAGAPGKP